MKSSEAVISATDLLLIATSLLSSQGVGGGGVKAGEGRRMEMEGGIKGSGRRKSRNGAGEEPL